MLSRWAPFTDFDRLFVTPDSQRQFSPAVDILEEYDAIVLTAEVPGMKSEDIQVHVENNVLTLRGARSFKNEEKKQNLHRVERAYGSFVRSFSLPKTVDADAIGADLRDGVLTLRLPKKAAAEKRRIEVRAS